ncbi:MAG TPA: DUF1788 domain-containing protein [Planctomycetaceae bacterium]|nr:DUF1788 domain-containing protein [Planctomycetaceae bacterium]
MTIQNSKSKVQNGPIPERFEHIHKVICSRRFQRMEGIGNEVPFFVVPYCPTEQNEIAEMLQTLIRKLKKDGIHVLEINLYDIAKELADELEDWDYWIKHEAEHDKQELLEALQSLTDAETKLAPTIEAKIQSAEFEVMFLTGVGEVFPYIRSHTVLNNLQRVAKYRPTIMFFPGDYSHSLEEGASLDLFGRLRDDKYYRAFNLYERET